MDKRNRNINGKVENKSVCYGMNRQILDRFSYSACWHSNHSYSGWWVVGGGDEPNQGLNVEGLTLPSALLHARSGEGDTTFFHFAKEVLYYNILENINKY